jgi:hypothetical protein
MAVCPYKTVLARSYDAECFPVRVRMLRFGSYRDLEQWLTDAEEEEANVVATVKARGSAAGAEVHRRCLDRTDACERRGRRGHVSPDR